MKKFIVHTRPIPGTCKIADVPAVVEVEGELVSAMQDPSVSWLPSGEFYFSITQPEFLCEAEEVKQPDGSKKKVVFPVVYHSHAIYHTMGDALTAAEDIVRESFEFVQRKTGIPFTTKEVEDKWKQISEVLL